MPRYPSDSESDNESHRERRRRGDQERPGASKHLNTWFIEGRGIIRQVLQGNIQRMLGPDAVSFPGESKVTISSQAQG